MTIGKKIIFSSTFVAILAGIAVVMACKNTKPIQNELVNTIQQTKEEIQILDKIKYQISEIQLALHEVTSNLKNAKITDANQHTQSGKDLNHRITALKNQIETSPQFRTNTTLTKSKEQILTLCESLQGSCNNLFPSNNIIPEPAIAFNAEANSKQVIHNFLTNLQVANNDRFSLIETNGKTIQTQVSNLNFWILLIGGLTCLSAIIFGRIIASNLSTEINKLRDAATQLNNGDYSARVGLTSNDEFGKLGQTFDGMAANLEQSKVIEEQKIEMEQLNEKLKLKNDSLDSFVYRVSHDLKAPVVNIQSLLKMIKIKMAGNKIPELTQPFFFLDKSVNKLEQTIFDLLEVSRIEQSLETTQDWINLEETLAKVETENSESIEAKKVIITSDFKVADLYFSVPNLESILSNIITNGIKYSSDQRQPEIHLATEQENGFVCLRIKDNGIGMDLEKHGKKLFGMFNRFHNHVEGSGVGLYIVKKIIEKSGGRIEVESQVNQGTTFSIFFNQTEVPAKLETELMA